MNTFFQMRSTRTLAVFAVVTLAVTGMLGVPSTQAAGRTRTVPGGGLGVSTDVVSVAPGDVFNYTVTLTNGSVASDVTVEDNLPNDVTLLAASEGCSADNGAWVNCSLSLGSYEWTQVTLTLAVDPGANCDSTLRNTVRVQGWGNVHTELPVVCTTP